MTSVAIEVEQTSLSHRTVNVQAASDYEDEKTGFADVDERSSSEEKPEEELQPHDALVSFWSSPVQVLTSP
jgi:hypothetical protein